MVKDINDNAITMHQAVSDDPTLKRGVGLLSEQELTAMVNFLREGMHTRNQVMQQCDLSQLSPDTQQMFLTMIEQTSDAVAVVVRILEHIETEIKNKKLH